MCDIEPSILKSLTSQNDSVFTLDMVSKRTKTILTLPEVEAEVLKVNSLKINDNCNMNNFINSQKYDNCNKNICERQQNANIANLDKSSSSGNRLCKSVTDSSYDDSSSESGRCCSSPHRRKVIKSKQLPPIGVFWDIENCQVPKGRSAAGVVQQIREVFFSGYREAEFLVVCDVKKENSVILQELNDAQVNLIHVAATCKNAADEKLRQAIRRFADTHKSSSTIILISSDINFAPELSDLRHRKRIHIILLHNQNVSEALILCANEHYIFNNITEQAPLRNKVLLTPKQEWVEVVIWNLPRGYDIQRLKARLKQLSDNCGGKVIYINSEKGTSTILFRSLNAGIRAQKRMDGEDVFGHRIVAGYPRAHEWERSQVQQNAVAKQMYFAEMGSMYNQSQSTTFPLYSHWNNNGLFQAGIPGINVIPSATITSSVPTNSVQTAFNNGNGFYNHSIDLSSYVNNEFHNVNLLQQKIKEQQRTLKYNCDNEITENCRRMRGNSAVESMQHYQPFYVPTKAGIEAKSQFATLENGKSSLPSYSYFNNGNNKQIISGITEHNNVEHNFWKNKQIENRPECTFQPIQNADFFSQSFSRNNISLSSNGQPQKSTQQQPVELIVTNLDTIMDQKQMRRTLLSLFKKHAHVLSATFYKQPDGSLASAIKVASSVDAQLAISRLHRHRIGYKRIFISYANPVGGINPQQLKAQIVSLLQDIPDKKLPVFKFRELFEIRYLTTVSMSELHRLRDVCTIVDDANGRTIVLNNDSLSSTPSPDSTLHELLYCAIHYNTNKSKGWAEMEVAELPNIRIGLKLFTGKVHVLLQSHKGVLPLQSFQACYESVIGESLPIDETGVPIEHLITCVAGVELKQTPVKHIIWSTNKTHSDDTNEDGSSCYSSSGGTNSSHSPNSQLATQLALFAREIVDLLRVSPHCRLSFNRFIPAYHHHFGRQCRVADYGFTKLAELFDSLPHVVQILGEGTKRSVTLSHRAQIRRFTSDLLRMLKSSTSRQLLVKEFAVVAERTLGKSFDPVHYGVCELDDLLAAIPEYTIVVTSMPSNDTIISLPKREQTTEEINRTKQFAVQVIELLRHEPQCQMQFGKFVPAYHHYFNQQCRVADYGFTKLIELFEALPHIVEIEEQVDEDRLIRLTSKEALHVLSDQITQLILCNCYKSKQCTVLSLSLADIPSLFLNAYGFTLKPETYQCKTIEELLQKLNESFMVSNNTVQLVCRPVLRHVGLRLWRVLMQTSNYMLPASRLSMQYRVFYDEHFELSQLVQLSFIAQIIKNANDLMIELTPLYIFAAKAYNVLYNSSSPTGSMTLITFDNIFSRKYGPIKPELAHCPNLPALICSLPDIFALSIRNKTKRLSLHPQLLESIGLKPKSEFIKHYSPILVNDSDNSDDNNSIVAQSNAQNSKISPPTSVSNNINDLSSLESTVKEFLWPVRMYAISNQVVFTPPKPDTPSRTNFTVDLPPITPFSGLPPDNSPMITPARVLFKAIFNEPNGTLPQHVVSPPASALPQPKLDAETELMDDSKTENNNNLNSTIVTTPCSRGKRKLRVAAQFQMSPVSQH